MDEVVRKSKRAKGDVSVVELMAVYPSPHLDESVEWAIDDLTGKELDIDKVNEARLEEITFVKNIPLYEEVDTQVLLG